MPLTPSPAEGIPLLFLLYAAPHLLLLFTLGLSVRLLSARGAEGENSLHILGVNACMSFFLWELTGDYVAETIAPAASALPLGLLFRLWAIGTLMFVCAVERRVWLSVHERCRQCGRSAFSEFILTNAFFAVPLGFVLGMIALGFRFFGLLRDLIFSG